MLSIVPSGPQDHQHLVVIFRFIPTPRAVGKVQVSYDDTIELQCLIAVIHSVRAVRPLGPNKKFQKHEKRELNRPHISYSTNLLLALSFGNWDYAGNAYSVGNNDSMSNVDKTHYWNIARSN